MIRLLWLLLVPAAVHGQTAKGSDWWKECPGPGCPAAVSAPPPMKTSPADNGGERIEKKAADKKEVTPESKAKKLESLDQQRQGIRQEGK